MLDINSTSNSKGKRDLKHVSESNEHIANPKGTFRHFLLWSYKQMLRSRLIDEKAIVLYKQNKSFFQIGCAGHEGVQVAAASVFRAGQDWFYPYYRDMALCAALGMTDEELFLNIMSKADDPNSHGRMMPMHYGHAKLNIVQQSSPTGSQFLQAVGCAMASKMLGKSEVTYVSSGEGACAQGDFHEALNWAARDKLPVIFVIQNNEYAISVPVKDQIAGLSVAKLVKGYKNLEALEIDGTDVAACQQVLEKAHRNALEGKGPTLIEAHVPRLQSHSISDNHLKYKSTQDIDKDQKRCPIIRLEQELLKQQLATPLEIDSVKSELRKAIDLAAEAAEKNPDPDPASILDHNYKNPTPWVGINEDKNPQGQEIFLVDALNHALDEELERDPTMCIFGQDVAGGKGGVFTVTAGLTAKYGKNRVFNSQLAESSIAGAAVGLATRGVKAVPEIQFGDYIWTAMNQIRNEMALMHYRSGGDFSCPVVMRVPVGGYIRGGCYHSQNIEATFSHFPGLFVVYPSNATDAKGLLKAAIRGKDPVLFLEHKGLYRQVFAKGPEGGPDSLVPIGKGKIVRTGTDMTIVTWGALVHRSAVVADKLAQDGIKIEVLDLRSIVPLDMDLIFESVRKTGRVLVAHEDVEFMGFGAEIAAQIADKCFTNLDAPIRRVGMKYCAAVPQAPGLEAAVLPNGDDIEAAAMELLKF